MECLKRRRGTLKNVSVAEHTSDSGDGDRQTSEGIHELIVSNHALLLSKLSSMQAMTVRRGTLQGRPKLGNKMISVLTSYFGPNNGEDFQLLKQTQHFL